MRQRLLIALLGVALAAIALFPFTKSGAQRAQRDRVTNTPAPTKAVGLPNFDVRLANKSEFTDSDLHSARGRQEAAESKVAAVHARVSAMDQFRAGLKPEAAAN